MKYLYNPPLPVKFIFNEFLWHSAADKVLFTFDDGPVPGNTESILKKLNQYNIKAVFFCVGNNVKKYPGLISEILSEGHLIGNHTMNHKILTYSGEKELADEILTFNRIMEDEFGILIKNFRPPHGKFSFSLNAYLNRKKLKNIMWSLLTYDYKNNIEEVRKSLIYLKSNSIIVLHDSLKSKDIIADSIELIFESVKNKNFTTGTPLECLK